MPQLDTALYIPQLFWLGIFFLLLFGGIYFFIEPRFQRIFYNRASKINEKLKEIEDFKTETEHLRLKAEQAETQFQNHVHGLIRNTTEDINRSLQAAKETHHKTLVQELALFDKALEKEHDKLMTALHTKEEDFVQEILGKLVDTQQKDKQ